MHASSLPPGTPRDQVPENRPAARDNLLDRLNRRQRQVLFYVSKGLRNSEIAANIGLSERMIKHYVSQLLLIFGASNRTELVGLALADAETLAALARQDAAESA
jgi:DNA-binding CsgD family transcriptional regulator